MSRQPRSFLGVRKRFDDRDVSITEVELEYGVSAGVFLRSFSEDMLPPYDEHLARIRAGKSLKEWQAMGRWERALTVAITRIDNAVQNHQAEAEIKNAKRNAGS